MTGAGSVTGHALTLMMIGQYPPPSQTTIGVYHSCHMSRGCDAVSHRASLYWLIVEYPVYDCFPCHFSRSQTCLFLTALLCSSLITDAPKFHIFTAIFWDILSFDGDEYYRILAVCPFVTQTTFSIEITSLMIQSHHRMPISSRTRRPQTVPISASTGASFPSALWLSRTGAITVMRCCACIVLC